MASVRVFQQGHLRLDAHLSLKASSLYLSMSVLCVVYSCLVSSLPIVSQQQLPFASVWNCQSLVSWLQQVPQHFSQLSQHTVKRTDWRAQECSVCLIANWQLKPTAAFRRAHGRQTIPLLLLALSSPIDVAVPIILSLYVYGVSPNRLFSLVSIGVHWQLILLAPT